jgi:hypothetical protein
MKKDARSANHVGGEFSDKRAVLSRWHGEIGIRLVNTK